MSACQTTKERDPGCDCQNPDGPPGVRHVSMECPVHNDLPPADMPDPWDGWLAKLLAEDRANAR